MAFCLIPSGGFFMSMPSTTPSRRPALASRRPRIAAALMLLAAFVAMSGRAARVDAAQGDLNCDGVVSLLDVPPFVLGLIDPAAYAVAFPACDVTRADVDGNAENDGRDIKAFVSLLLSPPPQEIVLRDSIGINSGTTDGNLAFANWRLNPSWFLIPFYITAPQDLTLTEFRAITCRINSGTLNYSNYNYYFRGWSSQAAYNSNPAQGNLFNVFFDAPSSGPVAFGNTGVLPSIGIAVTTYDIRFDLSSAGLNLAGGQSIIVVLDADRTNNPSSALPLAILESVETGDADSLCTNSSPPPNCLSLINHSWRLHAGRAAVSIKGVSN